jgi:hypothetical protein
MDCDTQMKPAGSIQAADNLDVDNQYYKSLEKKYWWYKWLVNKGKPD